MTKEESKQRIEQLFRKFEEMPDYLKKTYNEEQTKKNLILLLFEALGWDIESDEVQAEQAVSGGRVDYAFKLNGITQFYVEAKPIKADLERNDYQKQLIEYAYNKDVAWGVLTNFEDLFIFNALEKDPKPIKFNFKDYLKDFDLLWLISKESFTSGEINKWAERLGIRSTPVHPVGKQLAKDLIEWRNILENFISKYAERSGRRLTQEEVDEAVQKFLDRLIFIRVAEDRGLEDKILLPLYHDFKVGKKSVMVNLGKVFREFDSKYDSTLFDKHFSEDLDLELIEDNIAKIIHGMHFTNDKKRYDFSLIDVEILGTVYEQYLGTIQRRGTGAHRKEHGIYYTPKFIVNYIVGNTLGKLLYEENLPTSEVKDLKILDPACGSGSFLIKSFEVLDKFYSAENTPEGERRTHILTKNLYGVDLDPKAIEVTQLNLMLSAAKKRELLPELRENQKVGNSLVSGSETSLRNYFGKDFSEKRPFSWESEFKEVFTKGGFDVIIGNPPYIDSEEMVKSDPKLRNYCTEHYKSARGNWDLFCVFIEKGIHLLRPGGLLSMIIPNKLISADYAQELRKLILEYQIVSLRDYSEVHVFDVAVYPVVITIRKEKPNPDHKFTYELMKIKNQKLEVSFTKQIDQDTLNRSGEGWSSQLDSYPTPKFLIESEPRTKTLDELCDVHGAFTVGEAYEVAKLIENENDQNKGRKFFRFVNTGTIDRLVNYWGIRKARYLGMSYDKPVIYRERLRELLPKRFHDSENPKIIVAGMAKDLEAFLDIDGMYVAGKSTTIIKSSSIDLLKFIAALVNSNIMSFIYKSKFKSLSLAGGYFGVGSPQLKKLPIVYEESSREFLEIKNKIITLTDGAIATSDLLHETLKNSSAREERLGQLGNILKLINSEVYRLYNLTPEEIKIVEESSKSSD